MVGEGGQNQRAFQKTGFEEAEATEIESTESEKTFEQADSIWRRAEQLQPEKVEAVIVEDDSHDASDSRKMTHTSTTTPLETCRTATSLSFRRAENPGGSG